MRGKVVWVLTLVWCAFFVQCIVGAGSSGRRGVRLRLVAEYKHDILCDISSDGRLVLFYRSLYPTRSYRIYGGWVKANQPEVYDDELRVVDLRDGREVSRIRVEFFPENEQFIPGTRQVFYGEPKPRSGGRRQYRVWDVVSGQTRICLDAPEGNFSSVRFLNHQHALGVVSQQEGESLGRLILEGCTRQIIAAADPSDSKKGVRGQLALSPDRCHLAYTLDSTLKEALVRDAATLKVIKRIESPSGLFLGDAIYTPDGKFLLVVASNTIFDKPETKRYLLFYDTTNYEVVRRLDVTSWSQPDVRDDRAVSSNVVGTAMAVSPDSRMLAVAYTSEERGVFSTIEQAHVVLYDLASGSELARASHPAIRQRRDDPFAARVNRIAFTPDGKYMLTSTYDTRVWRIE
mgnify:CR=1 FL=1